MSQFIELGMSTLKMLHFIMVILIHVQITLRIFNFAGWGRLLYYYRVWSFISLFGIWVFGSHCCEYFLDKDLDCVVFMNMVSCARFSPTKQMFTLCFYVSSLHFEVVLLLIKFLVKACRELGCQPQVLLI